MASLSLRLLRTMLVATLFWLTIWLTMPLIVGTTSYYTTFGGIAEQKWLDDVIRDLKWLRTRCNEPDLQEVLDYTIRRYDRIGPFNVAVTRIPQVDRDYVVGCNNPLVPGLTIDLDVLQYSIHDGAMVLVHEALHDYWPCLGHAHVDPIMKRLERCL